MAGRPPTVKHLSHGPVKKLNFDIELLGLSSVALKILSCLEADGVASEAARIARCTKANVSYWTKRFIQAGALRLQQGGFVKYYALTPYGSKLLTGSEVRFPVVFEDMPLKFRVLEREKCRLDWVKLGCPRNWVKLGCPRNWVKLGVRVGEVRVVLNQGLVSSVVIHPGQMKGFDVDVLEMDSARVVERARFVLEGKFGLRLSDEGVALHGPRWRVYRPECHRWVEAGTVEVSGVGALDHSPSTERQDPLSRRPHLEFDDKRYASVAAGFAVASDSRKRLGTAAVMFPLTLEAIEGKVDFLAGEISRLASAVEKLVNVFSSALGLEGMKEQVVQPGGNDYVS